MIDSHSHIYCDAFDDDRDQVIARAREAGVRHIIMPNENLESLSRLKAVRDAYGDYVSLTIGLHPEDVDGDFATKLTAMHQLIDDEPWVAVGEVGIDLYWDRTWRDQQLEALDTQLHWCIKKDIPFIMHCRDGLDECLWMLDNFGGTLPRGVFHSFTGTVQEVEAVRRRGDFYFGVNGIVTFKKSAVKEILPVVGLDRLLLETDSPYLAPVPNRGKRNESANIPHICRFVAEQLGVPVETVSETTDRNVADLFRIEL